MISTGKLLVGKFKGNRSLSEIGVDGRLVLKFM
jgi:hypothetical protein